MDNQASGVRAALDLHASAFLIEHVAAGAADQGVVAVAPVEVVGMPTPRRTRFSGGVLNGGNGERNSSPFGAEDPELSPIRPVLLKPLSSGSPILGEATASRRR